MSNRIILNTVSYHGKGAIKEIPAIAKAKGFAHVFVCSDPDLIQFGVTAKVTDLLDEAGIAYTIYSGIKPNPTIENVRDGVEAFKACGADSIITIGAHYDTPHGVACAMMLPLVMEYNQDCTGEKYREIARAMGVAGVDEMTQEEYRKAAVDAVKQLSADVGIPEKNEKVREEDLDVLAADAYADACRPGNPRDTSVEDLKALYRKIMP
ncbi:MAG: iron-containing alcohol dehydrogenase [Ruminococcus sp.]|nr:iron-containing alcohol dehydrogenase [Ruminococcus sp.]MBQ5743728.1 iron-containing alcohol dehydrogenase [Ruminococcus sp.]